MINWIKGAVAGMKASRDKEQVNAGFAWAAGELLAGQNEAADYIEDVCFGNDEIAFYRGAMSALCTARRVGLVRPAVTAHHQSAAPSHV